MKNKLISKIFSISLSVFFVLACFLFSACSFLDGRKYVELYETTGTKSQLLTRRTDLTYDKIDKDSTNVTVKIDEKKKFQNFYGTGSALTHSSAYMLNCADEETREDILQALYGNDGARFNFVRVPIGASDYIETDAFFTLDDIDDVYGEDLSLSNFSIANDSNIISVLKRIAEINPEIKIIGVPWSAPAWMKSNHSLIGGTLSDNYIDAYASYLVKFVSAYKAEGINVNYLSLVNEPYVYSLQYPYMGMDGIQSAQIIRALGPKLDEAGLKTKVFVYDHNYTSSESIVAELHIDGVMQDEIAKKYVAGIAFHGYDNDGFEDFKNGLDYVHDTYKTEMYITEITEHDQSRDFASNMSYSMQNILINPINANLSGALYWNMVLDSNGQPVFDERICYGVISLDREGDGWVYKKNASYYSLAHFSKFAYNVNGVAPIRVLAESSNEGKIIATAFYRADKRLIIVAHNTDDVTYENVDFIINGKQVSYKILPQSTITLVC